MKHEKLRPETVRIMGRNYVILYEDKSLLGSMAVGMCNQTQCIITVQEDQHPVEEADTLLHEIMHAVWYCMAIPDENVNEEQAIRSMATGMMAVIMDNPKLLKYFQSIQNPPHLEL